MSCPPPLSRKIAAEPLRLGFGTMGVTTAYGSTDREEATQAIFRALDLGVTHFDTAELYGWGAGEDWLGNTLAGHRDEVVIATKFGYDRTGRRAEQADSRPDHIRQVVERSLQRLRTDYIDVLYQHRLDPGVPIEEVAGTVGDLCSEGKVRVWGLCEVGHKTLAAANSVHPVSVLQTEYSLFERGVESLFPTLERLGVGLVAYAPLGRGLLAGYAAAHIQFETSDARRRDPRFEGGNRVANEQVAETLRVFAEDRSLTLPQLALAWILAHPLGVTPIPGMRSVAHVEDNVKAETVALSRAEYSELNALTAGGSAGERYPARYLPRWV